MHTSMTELRKTMSDTINKVTYTKERVIIEKDGKPAAALVSIEDLEVLEALEAAEEKEDMRLIKERENEERVSFEEVKHELGL